MAREREAERQEIAAERAARELEKLKVQREREAERQKEKERQEQDERNFRASLRTLLNNIQQTPALTPILLSVFSIPSSLPEKYAQTVQHHLNDLKSIPNTQDIPTHPSFNTLLDLVQENTNQPL